MPLIKYKDSSGVGVKNSTGIILIQPTYDEVFLTKNGFILGKNIYDDKDDYLKMQLSFYDKSGDYCFSLNDKLQAQGIDHFIELWQLDDNLFEFQYRDWDSLELNGIFNEFGDLILKPEYDEVNVLGCNVIMALNGAHYEEYDRDGNSIYGWKMFNLEGEKMCDESIEEWDIDEDGTVTFKTTSGRELKARDWTVYTEYLKNRKA